MNLRKLTRSFPEWLITLFVTSNMSPRVSLDPHNLGGMTFKTTQAVSLKAVTAIASSFLTTHQV